MHTAGELLAVGGFWGRDSQVSLRVSPLVGQLDAASHILGLYKLDLGLGRKKTGTGAQSGDEEVREGWEVKAIRTR